MFLSRNISRSAFREFCFVSRAARVSQPRRNSHNTIQKIIEDSIKASGPIPVSTYMQLCLSHTTEGYYTKTHSDGTDVFGTHGDFITSPEISQVFGELVCLWFMSQWLNPSDGTRYPKIRVVELGPGRGTLMQDFIRTLNMFPDSRKVVSSIHLVETSPYLRSRQTETLKEVLEKVSWHDSIESVPLAQDDEFTMIVAHEFFDALPINVIKKTQQGFREVLVDLAPETADASSSRLPFQFTVSGEPSPRSEFLSKLSPRFEKLPEGSQIEVSNVAWKIARRMGELLSRAPESQKTNGTQLSSVKGSALVIDYGDEHAFPSSFRAFKQHRQVDVFKDPGKCDLTANVDFALLKEALQDIATPHGPLDQRNFLLRMGIMQRMGALAHNAKDNNRREAIQSAGLRLIDRAGQGMGRVYRVLGITGGKGGGVGEVWPFVTVDYKES